ncbi:alpha/beta fold hydrolase [Arthrobacter sp. NPDC089319]|uniref:alpha/beta fold hydrolase n=1 Tax=Arthrobacter sp. NPDC089319 TaxID=3155915 RepID=UPI00343B4583
MLNSFGTSASMWRDLRAALPLGLQIVDTELPGHGPAATCTGQVSHKRAVESYTQLAISLAETSDVHICGVSWGGALAISIAAAAPESVASVTAINAPLRQPNPEFWTERARHVEEIGLADVAKVTPTKWFSDTFRLSNPDRVAELQHELASMDPQGYASAARALSGLDIEDDARSVKVPSLVVASTNDRAVDSENSQRLAQLLGAETRLHHDAGHLLPVEIPEWLGKHLTQFIDQGPVTGFSLHQVSETENQ